MGQNNSEFENVLKKYGAYIYNYAMKLTLHPQDAEDLAQDTFIKAWEKWEQLENGEAVSGWLRKICYNLFLMSMRKEQELLLAEEDITELEQAGRVMVSVTPGPEDEVVVEDEIKGMQNGCFYAMARKLSLSQRIAFSMVDMFGMTISECAELLGTNEGAVKGLLHRARMNLDTFFSGHCNLLDINNPCSCMGWINFTNTHDENQVKMRTTLDTLSYEEKDWHFDEGVRRKIAFLYQNIPDAKPKDEWYENVINIFKKI